jgi:hypothetical protein
MKQLIVIAALFSIAVISCSDGKKSVNDSTYNIQCSPKIQKVDGGIELIPGIEWEQSGSGSLTYSAITFYRKEGSSDLIRNFELQGGGSKGSDMSSSTVKLANIEEFLVLITIFDKDKNVLSREWHTTKSNG